MNDSPLAGREAPAHALAVIVTASGRLDERALAELDRHHAFEHLQVNRARFIELARTCMDEVGAQLCDCSWLRMNHLMYIDARLDAVPDGPTRLLVCGLGLAAITADGQFTDDERLVYEHALAHWHVSSDDIAHASLQGWQALPSRS
ncbi:hypothetical protein LJR039_005764 [Pseudorhodoferax sp. LjRoot39]|uniref:hypothetical protein n=1 Tax=Pseudorhodoferax sp. LjRoot39 TaxID=3342328 RepID=UPI003ECC9694